MTPPAATATVTTECGCPLTCDWPRGDRRIMCEHGRFWVIRKNDRHTEQYQLAKETFPS